MALEPIRSINLPLKGAIRAPNIAPRLVAAATPVRLQPNSYDIGKTKIVSVFIAVAALPNWAPAAAPTTHHP